MLRLEGPRRYTHSMRALRSSFAAAVLLLSAAACQPNVFHTEVKGETVVEGDPSPFSNVLGAFPGVGSFTNLDFNQNQEFKNQGVTKDQVSSVQVDKVTLKIVSPNDQDFSFLEELEFFAKAGDQEVKVAGKGNIDGLGLLAPNPILELDVTGAELVDFVTAPSMSIIVRGNGRVPPQDVKLEATVGLRVEVKIL